jgi:DNA-binding NarL/FixJ family response regulator
MVKTKVMLVDDSELVRKAVRRLFDAHPRFDVIGEAEDGQVAVERAKSLHPDLVILDLSMPTMSGLDAAPLLIQVLPEVWLILFTAHDGAEVRRLSRAAGIHAVVPKDRPSTHLIAQAEALVA